MIFARDGIPNIFHRSIGTFPEEDVMVVPGKKDVIYDPGSVKHVLKGAGILDNSETDENFGGLDDRGTEFNFLSLHINTMASMTALGLTAIFIGILLYCSSQECWSEVWRALKCCKCTMAPHHDQILYEPSTTIGSTHPNAALAPTVIEMEHLENAQYLKLAKQKKRPKIEGDKSIDFNEGKKRG